MPEILIVELSGEITPVTTKQLSVNELYKKCGYRKEDENFKQYIKWSITYKKKTYTICVYGKTEGKSGKENKFEFPPPFDNILFYGKLAIVNIENDKISDISNELWNVIYEKMFGGFEDLAATQEEDENEPDELACIDKDKITESGYLKDGFVVDDEEIENGDDDDGDSNSINDTDNDNDTDTQNESSHDNASESDQESDEAELKEVEYIFSDDDDNQ